MYSNNVTKHDTPEYLPRSRKGTGDLSTEPIATAGRTAQRPISTAHATQNSANAGQGKNWGFEFLDHPPPPRASGHSTPVDKAPVTESTQSEFNKMLVR
jgi:hypothetical protein